MFMERWTHELPHRELYDLCASGYGRVTIGFFDEWAKKHAAELGLTLVATDKFVMEVYHHNQSILMAADVLLRDDGDAPLIEGVAKEMQNMGLVPYVRQIEG